MNRSRFFQILSLFFLSFVEFAHADSLLQQAQDNIASGYYREAEQQLQQLTASSETSDAYTTTAVQGLQGLLALQKQHYDDAAQLLKTAQTDAQQHAWHDLNTHFSLYLGELHQKQAKLAQAQSDYVSAITEARALNDKALIISALLHAANLAIVQKQFPAAWVHIQQTEALLTQLPVNANSSQLWLNSGYQITQLYLASHDATTYLPAAFSNLNKALEQSRQTQQLRVQTSALKHLATLYQEQSRRADAIKLLTEAIQLAQKENAEDSLIDLEWQLGQLYKLENQPQLAIIAYKNALQHLENIRLDIPVTYEKGKSSFKKTFAPLYLGLADLLLQQAPLLKNKAQQQTLLHQAQDTIELIKQAELEDYFQSRCSVASAPMDLQKTDPHAAAIYPILLPDRTEIIVYTAEGLQQFTQPIAGTIVEKQARLFAKLLRNYSKFHKTQPQAEFLYQALIKPILPLLQAKHIETLIYIPDGALRSFPLSALYDGKKFLIEDYAIVTSPGMSLTATNNDDHETQAILFAGMSMPGNVVRDLPDSLLSPLVETVESETKGADKEEVSRYLKQWKENEQTRELSSGEQTIKTRALHELMAKTTVAEKIQHKLALPGVEAEIKLLSQQTTMPYSLNENFSLEKFSEMLTSQPYKGLHLASHGFFGATTEESFVMTHDRILSMNKLEALLNTPHFKKYPLDLIVLSACQTAEGDDRSPLGISGIAIKAKVHSAVGSLWPVSDAATSQLMPNFYAALKKPHYGKAKALREAELGLLKQKRFSNPALWSPFILVGNWW
jgi:CHAT domain-containing protein